MNFIVKLSLRLFFWAFIFGFVSGIFGISLALINIADFYLQEGTQQNADTYTYKVLESDNKKLYDDVITELQNIDGVSFVDPYFSPTNTFIGSINYFGFSASYPIQVKGIPQRLGQIKADLNFRNEWNSTDLSNISVLLPQQAITIYNSIAPQRSWPILSENSFLGLPGVNLTIQMNEPKITTSTLSEEEETIQQNETTNTENDENLENINEPTNSLKKEYPLKAIISGFDKNEFGTTITVSSEKLYAIFNSLGLTPTYDYIIIETIPNLTKTQARNTTKSIEEAGFIVASSSQESFQQGIFIRIKYTIFIFGFSILIAFILLLFYSINNLLTTIKQRIFLYRIWAIKEHTFFITTSLSFIFSGITGFISWLICFFAVIPAQKYIIDTISKLGINTPSLRTSVEISLETAFINMILYFSIVFVSLIIFYVKCPKSDYIKSF